MSDTNTTFWIGTLGLVLQVISLFPRDPRARTKDQEEALISLSDAYHATEDCYAYFAENRTSNRREFEIADKWNRVGILLRKYNENLANRLDLKSRYWREGANWSDEAIREAGIKLEEVWREVNVLLQNKK
jgi:hypothetical protein